MSSIKLFESKKVRTHWDSKKEQWLILLFMQDTVFVSGLQLLTKNLN